MKWTIQKDNDVGLNDDEFWEWWEVTDGKRIFKCNDKEDAVWLCDILNKQEVPND